MIANLLTRQNWVQDLAGIGPLSYVELFKFNEENYIVQWCDTVTTEANADDLWLLYKVSDETLATYFKNECTLLDILRKAGEAEMFVGYIGHHVENHKLVKLADIPEDYQPTDESFYHD